MCLTAVGEAVDCYVHAVTICNSLALLASQGPSKDFAGRIALLSTLQKCWLSGHSVLQLVCSCDGAIDIVSNVALHDAAIDNLSGSGVQFTADVNSWDIQSPTCKPCNDSSFAGSWVDSAVQVKTECPDTSEFVTEEYVAHGSELCCSFVL